MDHQVVNRRFRLLSLLLTIDYHVQPKQAHAPLLAVEGFVSIVNELLFLEVCCVLTY